MPSCPAGTSITVVAVDGMRGVNAVVAGGRGVAGTTGGTGTLGFTVAVGLGAVCGVAIRGSAGTGAGSVVVVSVRAPYPWI